MRSFAPLASPLAPSVRHSFVIVLLFATFAPVALRAQSPGCSGPQCTQTGGLPPGFVLSGLCADESCTPGGGSNPAFCGSASSCSFANCLFPQISGPTFEVIPQGGGLFNVRMVLDVKAPYNEWSALNEDHVNGTLDVLWFTGSSIPFPPFSEAFCELTSSDRTQTWVEQSGFTCQNTPQTGDVLGAGAVLRRPVRVV